MPNLSIIQSGPGSQIQSLFSQIQAKLVETLNAQAETQNISYELANTQTQDYVKTTLDLGNTTAKQDKMEAEFDFGSMGTSIFSTALSAGMSFQSNSKISDIDEQMTNLSKIQEAIANRDPTGLTNNAENTQLQARRQESQSLIDGDNNTSLFKGSFRDDQINGIADELQSSPDASKNISNMRSNLANNRQQLVDSLRNNQQVAQMVSGAGASAMSAGKEFSDAGYEITKAADNAQLEVEKNFISNMLSVASTMYDTWKASESVLSSSSGLLTAAANANQAA